MKDPKPAPELSDESLCLTWGKDDPEYPPNWSNSKKLGVQAILLMTILNSCIGSSLTSNAIAFIVQRFGVEPSSQSVLPISLYLIGYVFGPLLWAPGSEQIGRRHIINISFIFFTIFTMACALSPNWPSLLIFRLLSGAFGSGPIAIATGVLADMYQDPEPRGRAVAVYMIVTAFGPLLGPIISGYASPSLGWRWSFWIALMIAGATTFSLAFLPETKSSVLLTRRASTLKENPERNYRASWLKGDPVGPSLTTILMRPLSMLVFEPIVSASSAYMALVYTIFYMSFQAFPKIFQGIYGFSSGRCGLTYLPIGGGCLIFMPVFLHWDHVLNRARQENKQWVQKEEYRRLPLACIGGPLFAISLFWLGWSARAEISFVVPMLAGIPFGFGFICIFIALLNYMTDAYETYAASANAAASFTRSILATLLPLATSKMFDSMGIAAACSLLGGLATLMCMIPFIFIWKGQEFRRGSKLCNMLKLKQEQEQTESPTAVVQSMPS